MTTSLDTTSKSGPTVTPSLQKLREAPSPFDPNDSSLLATILLQISSRPSVPSSPLPSNPALPRSSFPSPGNPRPPLPPLPFGMSLHLPPPPTMSLDFLPSLSSPPTTIVSPTMSSPSPIPDPPTPPPPLALPLPRAAFPAPPPAPLPRPLDTDFPSFRDIVSPLGLQRIPLFPPPRLPSPPPSFRRLLSHPRPTSGYPSPPSTPRSPPPQPSCRLGRCVLPSPYLHDHLDDIVRCLHADGSW